MSIRVVGTEHSDWLWKHAAFFNDFLMVSWVTRSERNLGSSVFGTLLFCIGCEVGINNQQTKQVFTDHTKAFSPSIFSTAQNNDQVKHTK